MLLIKDPVEMVVHFDQHLGGVIQSFGGGSYLLLFLIIFTETGLVIAPFLPGDSLLFAAGAFAARDSFNLFWLLGGLTAAAILGDSVNYTIGNRIGEKIFLKGHAWFIKKEHLEMTHKFYEKYGGKTILLARFIPIIRTFAPFVAGIGKMSYRYFLVYNVIGALSWVSMFVLGGYYFGNLPVIKKNFFIAILVVLILSVLPAVIEYWKHRKASRVLSSQSLAKNRDHVVELDVWEGDSKSRNDKIQEVEK